jgi:non-ribosomal peptide synthetase-like protein
MSSAPLPSASASVRPTDDRMLIDPDYQHDPRWRPGDRLEHLFEDQCDRLWAAGLVDHLCVQTDRDSLTYHELDCRANRLARHLRARDLGPGDRVALLFDDPVHSYVAMLAVLKAGAAYVPLDPGFPADRIAYITADAEVAAVLTLSHLRSHLMQVRALLIAVDDMAGRIAAESSHRMGVGGRGRADGDLAYLIYTSGSTGKPKGVAVEHPSIVNFIRVAAEVYGLRQQDRIYQGLTIAFDFSFEEIWVPWAVGATLVPKPGGASLLGADLHQFLADHRVTALCCVPTLLATVEQDLPELRFLLVSGEACPHDLITRWHRPGRRFLNVYGPTEATVTATWTVVHPDRPVTIGKPLPTYTAVILDAQNPDAQHLDAQHLDAQHPASALPRGEVGEIGIAGIGLAAGYLNRDDLTAKAFVPDLLDLPNNPSERIYRTGDLGRVNEAGEIEYLGRIDMQVKIRGYRIELTEIESVLLQVPGIAAAVVDVCSPTEGEKELVGYYSLRTGLDALDHTEIITQLREQLPPYMVPAYLQPLPAIPLTPQDKVDRRALPPPTGPRAGGSAGPHVAATNDTEQVLAEALTRTLGLDLVSVEAHFFDDLGANSLLLARFAARVRTETSLPSLSMREIYGNPTIRQLARALGDVAPAADPTEAPTGTVVRTSTAGYWLVGALQLLCFLGMTYLGAWLLETMILWSVAGNSVLEVSGRSALFGVGLLTAGCLLPVLAKWVLIGRWTPREIRLWSLGHFRFWLVKTLIRANPLGMLRGSPLYNLYLRALGARIGAGATILARTMPVATDLITVGGGAIVHRDSIFTGYRAVAGKIQIGSVGIGDDAFVGDRTVLDIDTEIGDGAQLGHSSSLHSGQRIPHGERWHGTPARPTTVEHRRVEPAGRLRLRRTLFGMLQLAGMFVVAPLLGTLLIAAGTTAPATPLVSTVLADRGTLLASLDFYGWIALSTAALFVFGLLTGLATIIVLPRLLQPLIRPGDTYRMYGLWWIVAQAITAMTNSPFYLRLFGDSSAIAHYLQALGYRMPRLEQTGSNFGVEVRHDSPLLTTVGSGTMVSDGLSVLNTDYSASTFRVLDVVVGGRNFFGNNIAYPAGARVGENVLLGTKVMVPLHGPVRDNVGLLGSPCFEIPRTVTRDSEFDHLKQPAVLRRRLWRKNRHNAVSVLLLLILRWLQIYLGALSLLVAANLYKYLGELAIASAGLAAMVLTIGLSIIADRLVLGFRSLTPRFVSIYDPYFWFHERHWKLSADALFNGTPFKNVLWRLLGVRIGRRVFDDGCAMPEKTLITIGDDAVLNVGSVIQCHSLEDGTFKSDYTIIGSGVTLGVGAFVHYGVTIGDGASLGADAFLMKGESLAPFATWSGNPAEQVGIPVGPGRPAVAGSNWGGDDQRGAASGSEQPGRPDGGSRSQQQDQPLEDDGEVGRPCP